MTSPQGRHDRYPGNRPLSDSELDRRLFFGRKSEASDLLHQLLATNLVILYGSSGTGKTSLLRAGVFHRLREHDLLPVEVRLDQPGRSHLDVFAAATRAACEAQGIDYTPGEGATLWEFFKTAILWRDGALQTPMLVLDPFDELLTIHDANSRLALARALDEILGGRLPKSVRARRESGETLPYSDSAPNVKVLISLPESYLGTLEELACELPKVMTNRFRLTQMTREAAREAIIEPAALPQDGDFATPPFAFTEAALAEMLDALAGRTGAIEPFALQMLCSHVERDVIRPRARAGRELVVEQHDLGGRRGIDRAVRRFYDDALARIPRRRQRKRARVLCAEGLVSPSPDRRRLSVEDGHLRREFKVRPATLSRLVEAHVLHRERRLDSDYYELSHDRFITPVLKSRPWRMSWRVKAAIGFAGVLYVLLVVVGLAIEEERQNAEAARDSLAQQLDFLNYELSWKLQEIHQLELMESVNERVIAEYEKRNPPEASASELSNMAMAHLVRGDLHRFRGRFQEALDSYQQSRSMLENAISKEPKHRLRFRLFTAWALGKIADVHLTRGDLPEAGGVVAEQEKILRELTEGGIEDEWLVEESRDQLGLAYMTTGDILVKQGKLEDALTEFKNAETLFRNRFDDDPADVYRQLNVGAVAQRIGDVHLDRLELKEALSSFQQVEAIFRKLVVDQPDSPQWDRDLVVALDRIAKVRMAGYEQARSLAVHEAVRARSSARRKARDVASDSVPLGISSQLDEAQKAYDEALGIAQKLHQRDPQYPEWTRDLAEIEMSRGQIQMARGEVASALRLLQQAQQVIAELGEGTSEDADSASVLTEFLRSLGSVHLLGGNLDEAKSALDMAFGETEKRVSDPRAGMDWKAKLSSVHDGLGDVFLARAKLEEAHEHHAKALEIREELATIAADNAVWQVNLAVSLYKVASIELLTGANEQLVEERRERAKRVLDDLAGRLPPIARSWPGLFEKRLRPTADGRKGSRAR